MATSAASDTTQLPLDIVTEGPSSGKEAITMFEVGLIVGARRAGSTYQNIANWLGLSLSCVYRNYWLWSAGTLKLTAPIKRKQQQPGNIKKSTPTLKNTTVFKAKQKLTENIVIKVAGTHLSHFEKGVIIGGRAMGGSVVDVATLVGRSKSTVSSVCCKLNNNKNQKSVSENEKMEEIEEADTQTPAAETGVIMAGVEEPMIHFQE